MIKIHIGGIPLEQPKSQMLKNLEAEGYILRPEGAYYVGKPKPLEEMIGTNKIEEIKEIKQIKTKDFKLGQSFIKDNILYEITNIRTYKLFNFNSPYKKLSICGFNKDFSKRLTLVYPSEFVFNLDLNSNIMIE